METTIQNCDFHIIIIYCNYPKTITSNQKKIFGFNNPFYFGFTTSFLGMLIPSILNMTTVKISIEKGKYNAINFALCI